MRLQKRYVEIGGSLLVFVTDREAPTTNNVSERALRPSAIFRKVANGCHAEWGAEVFAAVRSVINTGLLNGLAPIEAIRATLQRRSIFNIAEAPR